MSPLPRRAHEARPQSVPAGWAVTVGVGGGWRWFVAHAPDTRTRQITGMVRMARYSGGTGCVTRGRPMDVTCRDGIGHRAFANVSRGRTTRGARALGRPADPV